MPDPRLIELTPRDNFRAKVASVIADMERIGYQPIIVEALRTPAQHIARFNDGRTIIRRGPHTAGPDGLARACDIYDSRWTFSQHPRIFWLRLGDFALDRGLNWGGFHLLPLLMRRRLRRAMSERDWNLEIPIGHHPYKLEKPR